MEIVDIDKCLFPKIFRLLAFTSENRVKMWLYRTPENVQLWTYNRPDRDCRSYADFTSFTGM